MNTIELAALSRDRRRLGNQYAHLDQLEQATEGVHVQSSTTSIDAKVSGRSEKAWRAARDLQRTLWKEWRDLHQGQRPDDPILVLDPERALVRAGFRVIQVDGLGDFRQGAAKFEVAAIIDPVRHEVRVAPHMSVRAWRFTLAHEAAHAHMHDLKGAVHRDRALDGSGWSPEPMEIEANKFASYFLMPDRLVQSRFRLLFLADCFTATAESLFALRGWSVQDFERRAMSKRELCRVLASAEQFNGRHFVSLADQFQVSVEAMAIRLEELNLVSIES